MVDTSNIDQIDDDLESLLIDISIRGEQSGDVARIGDILQEVILEIKQLRQETCSD
ncbi:hypothetical protein PQC39_gp007 [Vibrio phage Vp_R1]|uniref:Uncharacterized protein n=1 Tax=Vibrio phage Vp_R1 TaxID=2059867 RepID=A0A2H5BPV8_9CAUD|nr:hypothetical protein PQC39_gp007 [Vibrio phage Vp_R1]AUG88371.1 hypothetical protein VPR_007 [Vibrio phage Vp_R1]